MIQQNIQMIAQEEIFLLSATNSFISVILREKKDSEKLRIILIIIFTRRF